MDRGRTDFRGQTSEQYPGQFARSACFAFRFWENSHEDISQRRMIKHEHECDWCRDIPENVKIETAVRRKLR